MALFTSSLPFVHRFSFPDGQQRVDGGCAVMVQRNDGAVRIAPADDSEDFAWDAAQTAAFLAGEPLTLSWLSPVPARTGKGGPYVCCWVTLDDPED
jgi:hypothetical protein